MIIKGDPRDRWEKTKIDPNGGVIESPQIVSSWLMDDLKEKLLEGKTSRRNRMSDAQRKKTLGAVKNLSAKSLRFRDQDRRIRPIR